MPYLPHKTCCPDPVVLAAAIPDEANCSWLHQSHHCEVRKQQTFNPQWHSDAICCHRTGSTLHDNVIKWKHFPRNWPFVWGIHRSREIPTQRPVMICVWINDWVNNREAGNLRRHRGYYDVNVMGSSDGLFPDGTKPLPKPMLTNHQCGVGAFSWG